jgi:prepilin-type N-terminal cleavage/methylation domain-containing protein
MKHPLQNFELKRPSAPLKGRAAEIRGRRGFTLVELLAVIAVIAVLAALIIGVFPMVNQSKVRSRAKAEMAMLTSMIETYKSKKGFYPIDNRKDIVIPGNPEVTFPNLPTTLYYELTSEAPADPNIFIANSGAEAKNFARSLKESQYRTLEGTKLFGIPTKGPDGDYSYWRYDSSSTNRHHQEGFDLWIDVFIKGEKHTFKNWNE